MKYQAMSENSPKGCWRQREHYIGNSLCDAPSHRRTRHLDHRSPARQIGRSGARGSSQRWPASGDHRPQRHPRLTTTSSTSRESKSAVARLPTMPKPPKTLQKALKSGNTAMGLIEKFGNVSAQVFMPIVPALIVWRTHSFDQESPGQLLRIEHR